MYSNGRGDARSGLAAHPRDSSFTPSEHVPSCMWQRQGFLRDKFDRTDREKYASAKRDWAMDTRPSSTRSSNTLFSNVGFSGPSAKRRALGRHGPIHENSRYGSGADENSRYGSGGGRFMDSASYVRSPPENGKAERDFFISAGGPSRGYSSSPSSEKPGKDSDGTHFRGSRLSPCETRCASSHSLDRSPRFDPLTRLYGTQNACEGSALRERERSEFSGLSIARDMSYRDKERVWGRPEHHRRTYSLPKLDSPRDCSGGDRDMLEGRIDRYGSASSRELAFSDVFSFSNKEHHRYDWRRGDQSFFGGFKSRSSTCAPLRNSHLKDIGAAPARLEEPRPTSPPRELAAQNSLSKQSNHYDDAGHTSPKKRPRLTWGQGLAKYEKEKIEEDDSTGKKCEDDHHGIVESHEDMHASSDCQSRLTENGSSSPFYNQHYGREQDSCDSGVAQSGCEFERSSIPQDLVIDSSLGTHEPFQHEHLEDQSKADGRQLSPIVSPNEDMAFVTAAPEPSALHEVQAFLSNYLKERPNTSKDVLTQHVENVEQEIDRLEKELIKLGNGPVEETVSTCDASYLKTEVYGGESFDTTLSATEAQVQHCEDSSASVARCAENLPLLHDDNVVPEAPGCAQMSLEPAYQLQSDMRRSGVLDTALDINVSARQPNELQCEGGTDVGLVESILLSNHRMAERSLASLAHLNSPKVAEILETGRLYGSPQQADIWRRNAESHSRKRKCLQAKVVEKKASVKFLEKVLTVKFMALRKSWQQKHGGSPSGMDWERNLKVLDEQKDDAYPSVHQFSFKQHFTSGPMIMDFRNEEVHAAKMLRSSFHTEFKRGFLRMPAMVLGRGERELFKFEMKNGLVDDPVSAEQERKFSNPWSNEEKRLFLEKFSLFGKDFRRIAAYLEHKTVADCVEFYYKNKKTEEFEKVHQSHRLAKLHRRFELEKHSVEQSAFYLATSPSIDGRHYNACLEGLSLVAAAAAAISAPAKRTSRGLATQPCVKVAPTQYGVKGIRDVVCKGVRITHSRSRAPNGELDVEWSDSETKMFTNAIVMFGKNFDSISQHMGTRSKRQCQSFFSKARRHLGLDQLVERHQGILQASRAKNMVSAPVSKDSCTRPVTTAETDAKTVLSVEIFSASCSDFAVSVEPPQVNCDSNEARGPIVLESLQEIGNGINVSRKMSLIESVSHVLGNYIKQEAHTNSDSGDKSFGDQSTGARFASSSQMSNAPSLNPGKSCVLEESLVCKETLQFKNELVSMKAEPTYIANATGLSYTHMVSAPLGAPSTVSILAPSSIPVAPAVKCTQIKGHTLKGMEMKARREPTSWTQEEKDKFVKVLRVHGKNWDRLRESLPGKSLTQIKTYFQNSKAKLGFGPEGGMNGNGRVFSSRKRKVDDSDSSSNAGSGGHNTSQKVPADDANLKVSPSLFVSSGGVGSHALAAELMYGNFLSRNSVDDSGIAQKVIQSKGLSSSPSIAGISPLSNPSIFTPANLHAPQQSYSHPSSVKVQPVGVQQPQQAASPLVVEQPLQQQVGSLGVHQMHQLQKASPSQSAPRMFPDLPLPMVQHLHKQPALVQSEASQQALLHQHQQQLVQQLSQQVAEAVMQESLPTHLLQRQQLQMVAQEVPLLQQVLSQHQAQGSQQASDQVASQLPQGATGAQLVFGSQPITNMQQLQQQAELFQSQLYQMHIKSPALSQQQQQQQSQKLQLLQRHWQQQQAHLQQASTKQVCNQLSQLQPLNFSLLNMPQQQLPVLRGIMQVTSACTEALKQLEPDNSHFTKSQQGLCEDLHQLPSILQGTQMPTKVQAVSESQLRATDVKLFGQSLLPQPASSGQQQSGNFSPHIAFPAPASSFFTGKSLTPQPPGDGVTQGVGWPHVIWPVTPCVNGHTSTGLCNGATLGSGGVESELCSVQEAVACTNERLIRGAKSNEAGQDNEASAPDSWVISSVMPDSSRQPCDSKRPGLEISRFLQDNGKSANKHRPQDLQPPSSGQGVPQGLPRVLDALVALAEWRIQNANGGSGKLTDEFLSQSWDALKRDPGSLVEAGRAGGSLAQMYAGNGEMLQHLKDGLQPPPMHVFAGANRGGVPAGSTGHLSGAPDGLSQFSSLQCSEW